MKLLRYSPCKPVKTSRRCSSCVQPMSVSAAQNTAVSLLPGFLTEHEVHEVLAAINRASLTAYTSNYTEDVDSRGLPVHTTTYLQTRGFLYVKLPWLVRRLRMLAMKTNAARNWGFNLLSCPYFNVRVAEYHDMRVGGSLPYPKHYDIGSLITIDIMLQEPTEGAQFQTLGLSDDGKAPTQYLKTHPFSVGDALVFVSHKYHSVTRLEAGNRKVLVVEFWHGLRRKCGHRCDKNFGICTFKE